MIQKTLIGIGLLFITLFFFIQNVGAEETVYIVEITGLVNEGTSEYIDRVIRGANEKKIDFIVIKLDTDGGLIKPTEKIVDSILGSDVKVIVYVHKEGGWAYSAGTYILMASDIAAVHPKASIGAAQPRPPDDKIVKAMTSWMKTLADINERNLTVAEKFVTQNLVLTGNEALEKGVIEYTPKNLEELFIQLNLTKPLSREINPTWTEKFLIMISHPKLISLFFLIGILGILSALETREIEIGGIMIIPLLLGLWGMGAISFSIMGIILIVVGIALLAVEFFEPGRGIFGIGGVISILIGLMTIDAEPLFTPGLFDAMSMFIIGAATVACIFFMVITRAVAKVTKMKAKIGPEALIGETAEVIEELNPKGRVKIEGENWVAVSLDKKTIEKGKRVNIKRVKGNTLYVEKV